MLGNEILYLKRSNWGHTSDY